MLSKPFQIFEHVTLFAAVIMFTGGLMGLYLKLFNMSPPASYLFLHVPILGAMCAVMVFRFRQTILGAMSILPFVLLAGLAVVSFKWSLLPSLSLREGMLTLILTLYLGYAGWRFTWREIIGTLWLAMILMVVFSFFLYVAVPKIGRMQEIFVGTMTGVWLEKNTAGQIGTFGALLSLARMALQPKKAISSMVAFGLFSAFLLLTTSKTSLVAYLLGVSMFGWVFLMRRGLPVYLTTAWTTIFGSIFVVTFVRGNTEAILEALGKNATFTGRSEIWKAVKISLNDRPLLGHGYSAYWDEYYLGKTISYVFDDLGFEPHHSHNSYIDMQLSLGQVGLTLFVIGLVWAAAVSLHKVRRSNGTYFAIPFIAAALVIGTFESVLAMPGNFAGAVIILVMAKMTRPVIGWERHSTWHLLRERIGRQKRVKIMTYPAGGSPSPTLASTRPKPVFVHNFWNPQVLSPRPHPTIGPA